MLLRHVLKLIFRFLLLAVALIFYFTDREMLYFPTILQQGVSGAFLWVVWIALAVDMLFRIIPNKRVAIGARKHFACSYTAPASADAGKKDLTNKPGQLHKGAFLSALAWLAVSAAIIAALFFLGMLTPASVLNFVLFYSALDLVFILVFCPLRALFMKNQCCVVCRIYNWDYFMMCAPLILFPGFYSISLVLLSVVVLLQWEIALRKNPRFFMRETNENLRCEQCKEKVRLVRCRRGE